jgi:alkaline phosphatase D
MAWVNDVPYNAGTYPLSASATTEFVVTPVTSDNLDDIVKVPEGTLSALASPLIRPANRHVQWIDTDRHGYGVLDLTTDRAQMDCYVLSDRTSANATASWARSYCTRSGTQKMERMYDPVGWHHRLTARLQPFEDYGLSRKPSATRQVASAASSS